MSNNDYSNGILEIRKPNEDLVPTCLKNVVSMTHSGDVFPLEEFYESSSKSHSTKDMETAVDNFIEFVANRLVIGDTIVYGKEKMMWAAIIMNSIPEPLAEFPVKHVPGTRFYMIMLPDKLEQNYLDQCLDNPE